MRLLVLYHRPISMPLTGASRLIVDTYTSLSNHYNTKTLIIIVHRVNHRTNINIVHTGSLKITSLVENTKLRLSLLPTRLLLKMLGESFLPIHVLSYVGKIMKSLNEVNQLAKKYEPDVIIAEQSYIAPLALKLARELNIPCILREHNIEFMYLQNISNSISRGFVNKFKEYEIKLISSFDKTLFISLRELKHILKLGISKDKVMFIEPLLIKHGVDLGSKYISAIGIDKDNYVLYVASSHKPNLLGLYKFLNAAKKASNVDFVICGTICNVIPRKLKEEMPKNVKILGIVNNDQLHTLYNYAKLIFAPLPHGTGIPIKLIEALMYSKPVVTTNNIDETLPMVNSSTIPMTDMRFLDELLIKILHSEKLYNEIKNAVKIISKYFDERVIARKYKEVLESLSQS